MMENTLCSDYKDQRQGREDIVIENVFNKLICTKDKCKFVLWFHILYLTIGLLPIYHLLVLGIEELAAGELLLSPKADHLDQGLNGCSNYS